MEQALSLTIPEQFADSNLRSPLAWPDNAVCKKEWQMEVSQTAVVQMFNPHDVSEQVCECDKVIIRETRFAGEAS